MISPNCSLICTAEFIRHDERGNVKVLSLSKGWHDNVRHDSKNGPEGQPCTFGWYGDRATVIADFFENNVNNISVFFNAQGKVLMTMERHADGIMRETTKRLHEDSYARTWKYIETMTLFNKNKSSLR